MARRTTPSVSGGTLKKPVHECIAGERRSQAVQISFRPSRHEPCSGENLHQVEFVFLAELWPQRMRRRISEECNLIRVGLQCFVGNTFKVRACKKKIIPQDYGAKALDRRCKLRVRIVFRGELPHFGAQLWIDRLPCLLPLIELLGQSPNWSRGLIRLAKGDVEGRYFGSVFMQNVQQLCKIRPRKRPAPENFLRFLIDIHDNDGGIIRREALGPVAKARIQSVEFQALGKLRNGASFLLQKHQVIDGECRNRDAKTKNERDAMPPPRLEKFVEAEAAPPLPPCA